MLQVNYRVFYSIPDKHYYLARVEKSSRIDNWWAVKQVDKQWIDSHDKWFNHKIIKPKHLLDQENRQVIL